MRKLWRSLLWILIGKRRWRPNYCYKFPEEGEAARKVEAVRLTESRWVWTPNNPRYWARSGDWLFTHANGMKFVQDDRRFHAYFEPIEQEVAICHVDH